MAVDLTGNLTGADLVALGFTHTDMGNVNHYARTDTVTLKSGATLTLVPSRDILSCFSFITEAGSVLIFDGEFIANGVSRFAQDLTIITTMTGAYTSAGVSINGEFRQNGGTVHCHAGFYAGGDWYPRKGVISGDVGRTDYTHVWRHTSNTCFDNITALDDPHAGLELKDMHWHIVGTSMPPGLNLGGASVPAISTTATSNWIRFPKPSLVDRGGARTFNFWANRALLLDNPVNGAAGIVVGSHLNQSGGTGALRAFADVTPEPRADGVVYRLYRRVSPHSGDGTVFTRNSTIGSFDTAQEFLYNRLVTDGSFPVEIARAARTTGGAGVAPTALYSDSAGHVDTQTFILRAPELVDYYAEVTVRSGALLANNAAVDAAFTGTREAAALLASSLSLAEPEKVLTSAAPMSAQDLYNGIKYLRYAESNQETTCGASLAKTELTMTDGWSIVSPGLTAGSIVTSGVLTLGSVPEGSVLSAAGYTIAALPSKMTVDGGVMNLSPGADVSGFTEVNGATYRATADGSYYLRGKSADLLDANGFAVNVVTRQQVTITEANGVPFSFMHSVNGVISSPYTYDNDSVTIEAAAGDVISYVIGAFGYRPRVITTTISEGKFTPALEIDPAVSTTIAAALRDEVSSKFAAVSEGQEVAVVVSSDLSAYSPEDVVSGFAYMVYTRGPTLAAAALLHGTADLYRFGSGSVTSKTTGFYVRLDDQLPPTDSGYKLPLVLVNDTGVESFQIARLNALGAKLEPAQWTKSEAAIPSKLSSDVVASLSAAETAAALASAAKDAAEAAKIHASAANMQTQRR